MAFAIPRLFATQLCLAVMVLVGSIATTSARAAQNLYAVAGVPVDVTADTVIEAREQAVILGQREGLRRLLQRLTVPQFYGSLPDVAEVNMATLVRSFGVEKEQLSANRYIAEVAATYDGNAVQSLLQGRGVPIVLEASPPILVVPARRIDGQLRMFDTSDTWQAAWNKGFDRNTLLDIVLPVGDLLDTTRLPASAGPEALQTGLATLAERYGAASAVLLVAEGEPADNAVEAALSSTSPLRVTQAAEYNWSYGFSGFELTGEPESVWAAAVAGSLTRLEGPWKNDRLVRFDSVDEMTVTAPLADLAGWAHIQSALAAMPEIQSSELQTFSQNQAVVRIRFVGGLTQFQRSLENRGLRLGEETGRWQLQRSGSLRGG